MRICRIITIIFLITMLFLSHNSFATSTATTTSGRQAGITDISETASSFIQTGIDNANTTIDTENLKNKSGDIYNLFLAVATAIAVIVGAMLGLKYMTAGIDKKVEVKESLFPYIISCIVVFGSLGIWKLVVTILKDF